MDNNKKYILTIETTGKIAGVALILDNKIIDENNLDTGLTHSVTLFNNISNILSKNMINMDNIDKICVSSGPGSFTGIRIGIAAALGLSKKNNTKIEYVDTLKSLSYNVLNKSDYIIPIIDAKCDRVYCSLYENKTLSQKLKNSICEINTLCFYLNKYFSKTKIKFCFVGDGIDTYKNIIKKQLKINYIFANYKNKYQKASSLAFVGGKINKKPSINYMLKSKAEREKNNG